MDIRQLRYFLSINRHQNMTRAAEELFITQQTLSKVMRNFEEELGAALFIRSAKGVTLTAYGECLLPYARKMIRTEESALKAIAQMKDTGYQIVHMGYIVGTFNSKNAIPPALITDWESANPGVSVVIEEYRPDEILQMVLDEELDCAYVLDPGDEEKDELVRMTLTRENRCILINSDHPLARKERLDFADIRELPVWVGKKDTFPLKDVVSAYQNAGYNPQICYSNGSFNQCVEHVRLGSGIMVAGLAYCMSVEPHKLAIKAFPDPSQTLTHSLVYKKGRALANCVFNLIQYVEKKHQKLDRSGLSLCR